MLFEDVYIIKGGIVMEEKELKKYLEQMVLEYASQMNEFELKYCKIENKRNVFI